MGNCVGTRGEMPCWEVSDFIRPKSAKSFVPRVTRPMFLACYATCQTIARRRSLLATSLLATSAENRFPTFPSVDGYWLGNWCVVRGEGEWSFVSSVWLGPRLGSFAQNVIAHLERRNVDSFLTNSLHKLRSLKELQGSGLRPMILRGEGGSERG